MYKTDREIMEAAELAMKNAYAPYSGFKVGAALITESGKVYTGCNIENSSYGATNCAERTAIFKAVSEGERKIKKIAIACSSGHRAWPCGICRQVLSEFMDTQGQILLEEAGVIEVYSLEELMPNSFSAKDME